ncbi:MAG: alanine racemase [Acidobacteria bacterium]|nr:alanine racemase [Acidobacteriota bacterium]
MVRPTHAAVDLDGLIANYRAIRGLLAGGAGGPPPRIVAVIKANAYGHGAARVALALEGEARGRSVPPPMLACADIEEGVDLRAAGVRAPILVFGALSVSDLDGVFAHGLTPTVSSPAAARALEQAAVARGVRLGVHLKIDTGMNRFGFRHDNLPATLPAVLRAPHLAVEAVYTHFATAEDREHPLFEHQRARFEAVRAAAPALGLAGVWWHAANSAALLRDRRTWYDAVRPGLLLYGIAPPPLAPDLRLRPVMSLRSRVVAVKGMRPGESAGYGARFVADRALRVALIPAGYADGLDLRLAGRGALLVGGVRAPVVAVSMDSLVVDVTGVEAGPGDEVVLLGAQGADAIGAREVAGAIGTVPHEILCRIGARIERTYNP